MSITGMYVCPECERAITTRSAATNMVVCSHCYAPIGKQPNGGLTKRINLLLTKDTATAIQIGTSGQWKQRSFEIIGRAYCVFEESYVNSWTMLLEDGTLLLLVESYGQFAVYEPVPVKSGLSFAKLQRIHYGMASGDVVPDKRYQAERRQVCIEVRVEGEAWLFDDDGRFVCQEMAAAAKDRLAFIGEEHKPGYACFKVHHQAMADFKFTNLRPLERADFEKTVTCPGCNAAISLHSGPLAQSITCTSCKSGFTWEKGAWKFKQHFRSVVIPAIPLQATGTIRGVDYRVVGFVVKADEDDYRWREYTLFSMKEGYAYLSEYNGHWMFVKETPKAPVINDTNVMSFTHNGSVFKKFNAYWFALQYAEGEFAGKVFENNKPRCLEFIAPPEIWVRELYEWHTGSYWYHGTHISAGELRTAFPTASLPMVIGVGAVQPAIGQVDMGVLKMSLGAVAVFFTLLYLLSFTFHQERVIYENTFSLPDETEIPAIVTPAFTLDKWRSNLEFEITAPVNNNWFETGITLVNADDGTEYSLEKGVEKYSGYEGNEYWSEGSDNNDAMLHSIPGGNYFLQIAAARESIDIKSFTLKVTYDVPMTRNFFLFALFALLPMLLLLINMYLKESMRWTNSPFSSVATSNE